ncbi:MAG: NAD(P)H-dependent oxidoreductase [Dinghuibacter sp.]|nr:NAD(P)H-dependent oxidoreductase [Dinghuibacter sp.]
MICIVSGTDRPGSNTRKIAEHYHQVLRSLGQHPVFLSLETLQSLKKDDFFTKMEQEMLVPATRYIFVVPEYNGSIPGVLKLLIDLSDVKKVWGGGKKALLTGVATGRAGNLRGMDHLTGILNHMGVQVLPNKLPISAVNKLLNEQGKLADAGTEAVIRQQVEEFLKF